MPRVDIAVVEHLRLRIDRNVVTDCDTVSCQVLQALRRRYPPEARLDPSARAARRFPGPNVCPDALRGKIVPRNDPPRVSTVQRAPSAKRLDQCPIGTIASRPFCFNSRTCAPRVSTCAMSARAGFLAEPSSLARIAPRRVSSYPTPIRSSSRQQNRTASSVYPVGLGISSSCASSCFR